MNFPMKIEVLICVRLIQSQKEVLVDTITGLAALVPCQESDPHGTAQMHGRFYG